MPRSLWARCALVSLAVCAGAMLTLAPYLTSSTELVRIRNALVLGADLETYPNWTPAQVPTGYVTETRPAPPFFRDVASRLELDRKASDWDKTLAIARELQGSHQPLTGGAIKADLRTTYQYIVGRGEGYCGDFVRAFTAIALAAGLDVRTWAFSFDGFGGHGHVFVEIWNRQRKGWELVDIYNNFYFTEGGDTPISARRFRDALSQGSADLRLHLLHEGSPPGYAIESKAWDYYRAGLSQWYAVWGNNLYSYDATALVRVMAPLGRSIEQLAGIAVEAYPEVRILASDDNVAYRLAMRRLQRHLLIVLPTVAAASVAFLVFFLLWLRQLRAGQRGDLAQAHGHGLQRPTPH